jgi:hypothetical protein
LTEERMLAPYADGLIDSVEDLAGWLDHR